MFGRKKDDEAEDTQLAIPGEGETATQLKAKPATAAIPKSAPAMAAKPEPRRAAEHPAARNGSSSGNGAGAVDPKRLIVGREIVLTGAINACDRLLVEGRIEATLTDCREMEITDTGTFKGEASVDVAVVSGHFEGTLTARELLLVRAKGRVSGTIRFARLEVERGGEIEGDVSVVQPGEADLSPRVHTGNGSDAHAPEEVTTH
jgi:cytoskeletal protein CcmA (bactofilin family)